ncbi:MAG: hypothetical protein AAGI88_08630 [Pseudomonadota bacterium]
MQFDIPQGESQTRTFTLTPQLPVSGQAQEWKLICDSDSEKTHISTLDIFFSSASSPAERLSESFTMKINIDSAVQTSKSVWRFAAQGMIFATNGGDDKRCFEVVSGNDSNQLVVTVTCLDNAGESFKFSFLAMETTLESGECRIFASADPDGNTGRRP